MKSLTKGDDAECGQVVALHGDITDAPACMGATMGEMA